MIFLLIRIFVLFFVFNLLESVLIVKAKEVACERSGVQNYNWGDSDHSLKTCFMDQTTTIDESNVKILTRDETANGFWLTNNKNVLNLPIEVAESFPNLLAYSAIYCSIKEISKANFNHLDKLKGLYLSHNQIEMIPPDSFNDCTELEYLTLSNNESKFIVDKYFIFIFILIRLEQNKVHEW